MGWFILFCVRVNSLLFGQINCLCQVISQYSCNFLNFAFVQIFWLKLFLSYYHTTFNLCYDDIFILELNAKFCNVSGWPGWKVWTHLSSSHSYIFSKFSNMPIMLNWKQTERFFFGSIEFIGNSGLLRLQSPLISSCRWFTEAQLGGYVHLPNILPPFSY